MTDNKVEVLESFNLYSGIRVDVTEDIPGDVLELVNGTVFGTEGALRYRHYDIDKLIDTMEGRRWMALRRGDRLLGTVLLLHRDLLNAGSSFPGLYVRYLSMMQHRPGGKPEKKKRKERKKDVKPRSLVKELLMEISDHELKLAEKTFGHQAVLYAYIEQDNVYSRNLCLSLGYVKVRKLATAIFSRLFPKELAGARLMRDDEYGWVNEKIRTFYKDYSFVPKRVRLDYGNYYILEKDGRKVAGLQAFAQDWDIVELPGFSGWIMRNVLPYIPVLRRLFNGDELRFLAFTSAWYEDGYKEAIPGLMAHACAAEKKYMGLYWADKECKVMKYLQGSGKLGIVHRLQDSQEADIMIRPLHSDPTVANHFNDHPAFIHAVDSV